MMVGQGDGKEAGSKSLADKAHKASVSEIPVSDFMVPNPVTIIEGTKIYTAIQTLATHHVSGAPVVDAKGAIKGMISEYDLLLQAATKDLVAPIEFTQNVQSVGPETKLADILVTLYKTRFRRLPVVDRRGRVLGTVSRIDVLKRLIHRP